MPKPLPKPLPNLDFTLPRNEPFTDPGFPGGVFYCSGHIHVFDERAFVSCDGRVRNRENSQGVNLALFGETGWANCSAFGNSEGTHFL